MAKFYKPFEMGRRGDGWMMRTLDKCASGRVMRVDVPGREGRRLMELGLIPGTRVRVLRRAPFGDPIQIIIRGYTLTLRRGMAVAIAVEADE